MGKYPIILIAVVFIIFGMGYPIKLAAQGGDCGNGMQSLFAVGDQGSAVLEIASRMYDEIDGVVVERLSAGEAFTVVTGPECAASGETWYQIENRAGDIGWVSEGAGGTYRLEPAGEVVQNDNNCSKHEPRLVVGRYAEINDIESLPIFTSLEADTDNLISASRSDIVESPILIVESPQCYQGEWIWRFRPVNLTEDEQDNFYWLQETQGNDYLVEPLNDSLIIPDLNVSQIEIRRLFVAPIIDPNLQLAFDASGGGGGTTPECVLQEAQTIAYYGSFACVSRELSFDSAVVEIFDPNGNLYSTASVQITVGNLRYALPTDYKLMSGVWTLTISTGDIVSSIAYILMEQPVTQATFTAVCDNITPVLSMSGYLPEQTYELALLTAEGSESLRSLGRSIDDYVELDRWQITTDENGMLLIRPQFVVDRGLFVVLNENNSAISNGNSTEFPPVCAAPTSVEEALANPIYGEFVAAGAIGDHGFYYYAFEVAANEVIDLKLVGNEPRFDMQLTLLTSDETIIAQNDDSAELLFNDTDSAIDDFIIPQDGVYIVMVSTIARNTDVIYMLSLEKE